MKDCILIDHWIRTVNWQMSLIAVENNHGLSRELEGCKLLKKPLKEFSSRKMLQMNLLRLIHKLSDSTECMRFLKATLYSYCLWFVPWIYRLLRLVHRWPNLRAIRSFQRLLDKRLRSRILDYCACLQDLWIQRHKLFLLTTRCSQCLLKLK